MDKRNLRSKAKIKQTLIRLSVGKPFTDITVRELCEEAGVSRSTFYANYRSPSGVIAEISAEYMEKIRGGRLTREFFETLTEDGDELKLLLETGIFGREFSLYLKEMIAKELSAASENGSDDLSLNIRTLYHAFGIFGVLQSLSRLYGMRCYNTIRAEGLETLMDLIGQLSAD